SRRSRGRSGGPGRRARASGARTRSRSRSRRLLELALEGRDLRVDGELDVAHRRLDDAGVGRERRILDDLELLHLLEACTQLGRARSEERVELGAGADADALAVEGLVDAGADQLEPLIAVDLHLALQDAARDVERQVENLSLHALAQ